MILNGNKLSLQSYYFYYIYNYDMFQGGVLLLANHHFGWNIALGQGGPPLRHQAGQADAGGGQDCRESR